MDEKLVKVRRSSKDIGLFGKKGSGKSTLLSILGFLHYMVGTEVYTNYDVNFPHIEVHRLIDLMNIPFDQKRKVFLGDDFDFWFQSRSASSSVNRSLNDILMFWGKNNLSLIYTAKRPMAIDIGLRESTSEFWDVQLSMNDKKDSDLPNKKEYMNYLMLYIDRFDDQFDYIGNLRIYNLDKIIGLFDTSHKVTDIRKH